MVVTTKVSTKVSQNDSVDVAIDSLTHVLSIIPVADWFGSFELVLSVEDPDSATDVDTMAVVVAAVNDPPVLVGLVDTSFNEDDTLRLNLDDFVDDVDDADSTLIWTGEIISIVPPPDPTDSLLIDLDQDRVLQVVAPADYFGEVEISLTV